MTSSEDLLALLWKITRGHLEGTYLSQGMVDTGEYIKSFDFFAFDYPHTSGSKRYNLEDFSSEADEKSKSQYDSMSIFSWILSMLKEFLSKNMFILLLFSSKEII